MRHEDAYERRASVWEDIGIGVAVSAIAGALIVGIGLWTHYVTGALFILATAILAWHSGFRPALITTALSTIAIAPLITTFDASADLINLPVRIGSVFLVCVVVSWLCGNLNRSRE